VVEIGRRKSAIKDRSVKLREIRTLLSEENIDGLTESDFRKIIALHCGRLICGQTNFMQLTGFYSLRILRE
jgi:hypothetical protein